MLKKFSIILLLLLLFFTACANDSEEKIPSNGKADTHIKILDTNVLKEYLSDWIAGSGYKILSGDVDESNRAIKLEISERDFINLSEQDKKDINNALYDLLSHQLEDVNNIKQYKVEFESTDNVTLDIVDIIKCDTPAKQSSDEPYLEVDDINEPNGESDDINEPDGKLRPNDNINLIFIHHSCGTNWLQEGLSKELNKNNYYVSDITYGWREYGDKTDTSDWNIWFADEVMELVYNEKSVVSATNYIDPNQGENQIIMFKSCFPNSDAGSSINDEKNIYKNLIPYFEDNNDKMFILITPPPMINISDPEKTRELCNWLVDRQEGWLKDVTTGNVFVFDFYNVLTHPNAHHYINNGKEVMCYTRGANELYYDTDGDDHPNREGNNKATAEFVSLLNHWYQLFLDR